MTAPFLLSRALEATISPTETSYITHDRVTLMNNMSSILAGIALLLCMIVLGFIFVIWLDKEARKCLDRVSFRLIVYSLLSNCIYAIGYIICVQVGPGFWCVAGVWLIQFWLGITNWLITFIAINLQLVLVHHCNGIRLEKWYLMFTVFINLATTLPPLIKGKFGWDPVIKVCWLTSDNDDDRLRWQISTQLAWILFTIFLTLLASIITIGHLYKHKFTSIRVLNGHGTNASESQKTDLSLDEVPTPRRRSLTSLRRSHHGTHSNLMSNQEFRKIILRISVYPIVMIILNLIITIADIRISTASGIYTSLDYGIYVIYYALYGARGIFYALIAIADPALMRGYRVWRGDKTSSGGTQTTAVDLAAEASARNVYGGASTELAGISVQTEIESYVQETKVYHDFAHDVPMPINTSNPVTGPMTHIEGSSYPTKPARVYKRQSNPDMYNSMADGSRKPQWNDPSESECSFVEERDPDECSISNLAPYPGLVDDVERLGVTGIRRRQLANLARRKNAEREMKRQI